MSQHRSAHRPVFVLSLCLALVAFAGCSKSVEERLEEAKLQQEVGSFDASIEVLQSILDDSPDHAEANLLLGTAQLATGQAALAIWPLEVAGRTPEFADRADLALGAAYVGLEQYDPALEAADRVLARDPDDDTSRRGAISIRASVHLAVKDWDAAIEDVDRLLAMDSESAEALALLAQAYMGAGRNDEAEAAMRRLWDSPIHGNSAAAARAGISLAKLLAYENDDQAGAEKVLEGLMERFPQNAVVLGFVTDFLRLSGRSERAGELLRAALDRDPGDVNLRGKLATYLREEERADEAEALLVEATELFDSGQSWLDLSNFYRAQGRHEEALAAFERILELVPGMTDNLRFGYVDLLTEVGQRERAAAVASELEGDSFRNVALGRLAYLDGNYEEALGLLDAGLREWPNNAGARHLAARSALALGDMERAISELREAVRTGMADTSAGPELGWIYLQMGRPAAAVALTRLMLADEKVRKNKERTAQLIIVLARAEWETGAKAEARAQALQLTGMTGHEAQGVLETARFENEEKGPGAAARFILESGVDLDLAYHETALRQACAYLVEAGQADEAVKLARKAVAARPDDAGPHDALGRVLVEVGRGNEALASFDRALELDPELAPAMEGQATLRLAGGDDEGAHALFMRAAKADEYTATYPYRAAQIDLGHGRMAAAEANLREALQRDPLHAHANNDLAWILAERGESLDVALRLARRASEVDPSATVFDTLGWVNYKRGAHPAAVKAFERARELDGASPSIAYRLALALVEVGERERAEALFREALATGPFPEADAARAQLARLTEAS